MGDVSKESVYYLRVEEVKKLIMFAPSLRDRVIIKILFRTGIRRDELRNLEIRDINFEKKQLYVRKGKGDKKRTVPIDPDTLQDIKFYMGPRDSGRLVITNKQAAISLKQINEICAKCGKLAGIRHPNPGKEKINPHLFRHSYARNMLDNGMRMEQLQKILGHSTIKTTIDVYGTPSMESIQKGYENAIGSLI